MDIKQQSAAECELGWPVSPCTVMDPDQTKNGQSIVSQ